MVQGMDRLGMMDLKKVITRISLICIIHLWVRGKWLQIE